MAARLGIVLYMACCGVSWLLGILTLILVVWGAVDLGHSSDDGTVKLVFAAASFVGGLVVYLLGLATRFVLCGDSPFDGE